MSGREHEEVVTPEPPVGCECVGWYVPGYRLIFETPEEASDRGMLPLFTWDTTE